MRLHIGLFLVSLGIFAAFSWPRPKIHSNNNHFVYQADAFLKGKLELQRKPPHKNDWASFYVLKLKGEAAEKYGPELKGYWTHRAGKSNEFRTLDDRWLRIPRRQREGKGEKVYFVSFPPAPAVLMMPFTAAVAYGANDVLLTLFFAALNVLLMFLLLERLRDWGHSERSTKENLWLVLLFGFGTAHLWCSVRGQVWFTALIIGVTFNLAYIYFAIGARRPFWAGVFLALGFATRATLVFAAVFFYWQLLVSGRDKPRSERLRGFALFSLPCLIVGLSLLAYNYARFANPMEFGHSYLATGTLPRIRDFGLFHPAFLQRNLHAAFTLLPRIIDKAPYVQISHHGMSMIFATPALLLLLWPRARPRLMWPLIGTALVIFVPILFYQNTGWQQYGFRFALDFMPYLVCALALGARPITGWVKALIIWGVAVNAWGAGTYQRSPLKNHYVEFCCGEPKRPPDWKP